MYGLIDHQEEINRLMSRYGVKFGLYKNNKFNERLFPFDTIPRIIPKNEFEFLEKGLKQRVYALNLFLNDIYSDKKIIRDKIIPEEFIYTSPGFSAPCDKLTPPKKIYNHISGIDLVQGKDMCWYVLEDNLRIPSGASYPMIARELCRRASPDTFQNNSVDDNRDYGELLRRVLDDVNTGGINVILTPGRYNSAFFEHSYLAERTKAVFAMPQDLFVEGNVLYYSEYSGKRQRVGTVYRRISDEYIDPMTFYAGSLLGVPQMIKYYLGEEPILNNAVTYLPIIKKDLDYITENLPSLVIKDVSESGGYGVIFGNTLSKNELSAIKEAVKTSPRRFIAQEVIDFKGLKVFENGRQVERKADLRAFVLYGDEITVWHSGLTRYSQDPDSFVVNSSQGGGFKDTWVLSR